MKKILLSLILCASFFTGLLAQQSATIGKKFHVAFSDNVGSGDRYLVLKIAVIKAPTEVEISFKDPITGLVSYHTTAPYTTSGNGYMLNGQGTYEFVLDNYIILPNIPQSLPLPWFFSEPKAVYVESKQEDIALYALNQVVGSAEATVVLPVETLDKEYLGLSHIGDKIIIVTTPVNDNTTITSPIISPPMPSPSTGATIINKYETAMSYLASDMTNVSIKADDDIAVFATVLQSNLGNSSLISSDNLFEQLWPTKTWGKKYVVPVTHKDELVRILPKNNSGATITITGGGTLNPTTTSYTIPAGAYYDVSITDVAYIDSNVPIAVNSFMMDSDPSQCWINPVEQMTTYTMVAPFISSVSTTLKEHRLIIVTRKEYKDETKINGQPNMQPLSSTDLGDYTVNVYNLTEDKPYSVENSYGFNAYVYGYGVDETYHFSAGSMAGDMSLYFSIDDIIDQVTSCESNIYPTTVPGNGIKISRHIESVDIPFDEVRWYINGTLVSGLTGETQLVQDWDWYIALNVPTDTIVYNLHTGNKNIIEMEVYNNNILVGSRIGEFCIVPPPEAHDDFGGGFGNGSDDGVSCIATGTADTIYIKIKDNDKNIKPRDSIRLKDPDISITTNNVDLKDTLNANATSNYKFITIGYKDIDNDGIIDTVMKYVPQNCFSGVDVVDYCITSAQFGERSCAKVKIVVVIPEAKSYEACPGAPVTIGVKAVPGMTFKWYSDKQLTTQIGTGNSIDITAPSSTTEYYAVPNTGNDIKIPVTVKINTTGCGSGTLCNGSLLYSETFESAPLQYLSDYAPDTNNPPDEGKYIITNTIPVHGGGSGNTMLVSGSTNAAANDTVLQIPVAGALCVGKYSFGAWIKNMNQTSENIVPVFRFMLIDTVNHVIVHSSNIKITSNNNWAQYGFEYDVPAGGLNGLKLVIVNTPDIPTGAAGGNRFAIDDVTFSLCLNTVITHIFVDPGETVCANKEVTFTGNIQNPNYKYYKWQFRANSSAPWTDLTPSGMLQPSIGIIEIPPYTFTTLANGASSGEYRFVAGISNVTDVNCVVYSSVKTLNVLDCFDLRNDSVAMLKNTTLSFDVLANDDYFCTPVPGNNFKIVTPANSGGYPKHAASYSIVSGKIQYQPANNYTGTDSVKYEVTCGGVTKTAWLSIFIVGQEKEYKTCDGVIETLSVNSIPGVTYIWYDEEGHDVTNAIGSSITTDNSSIKVNIPTFPTSGSVYYYVRLHYFGNGSDYLLSDYKIKIEVKQEDDCININGSGCADYTTLFKEDFGGNRTTDPDFASIMPQNSFGDFSIVPSTTMLNDGKCMITKRFDQPDSDDHTYDADKTRGYFMVAKTTSAASTFYRRDFTLDLCQPSDIVIGVWLRNMSVYLGSVGYPKVNIKLTEQKPGGAVLYEGSTGNISGNNIWQYKTFKIHTTGALHETVRLELTNDNIGTNAGLLLGLDDIEVQICTSAAIKAQIIGGGSVCEGLSKQFTASFKDELQSAYSTNNVEFVWQYSADGDINKTWNDVYSSFYDISTVNTVTYTINSVQPANTGYYRVVAKYPDSNYPNCSVRSDPVELVVLPLPVNSFELTPLTCSDVREIIKVNNETGSTIKWIYPATINGQTDNPLMYNLNQNKTIDTVVVEITGNGCVKYDTAKIVMPQPPKIDKTQDMNVCQNKSFTLTAKPQTPTTSLSLKIEWSENKDFTVLTGSHITSQVEQISETDPLTLATPGIHKYYIRISDNLCSAIDSITVTVLSLPQKPTITGPANGKICLGDTVQLTASLVTGLTYSWTPATGVVEPKVLDERTLTVSPTSDIQYTVTVITDDAYKCKSSETYSLKVDKEKPEVEIIDVQTCFGAANVYLPAKDNNSKTNSSNTYLWTYDNSNNSSLLVPTAVPGTYQYTVIVTGSNGCAAPPKTANVTVNALPVINNNEKLGNHEVCPGEQIVLTAQNGPYSYKWDNNETGQKITVSTSVPVTHTVTITELSTGCSVDDIASITVKPEPVITVTPEKDPICYGETVKLTASGEGVNPSTYTWDHGAAGWETYVSPLTTGVTTYKVTGTGTNGCSSSAIQQITVNPKPANPLVDGVKSVCEGKSTVLKVSNYISGNKYRWSHELGESQEPSAETTVTPPATTQYTVTVEDGNGCTASRTETVKVNTLPNIIAQKNDTTICEDAKINIWVAVDKNVSYKWSTGATSNNIPVTPSASEKYSVTVIDGNQCEAATEINVAVLGKPVLYIAGEKKICRGDQLDLSVSGASDYLWTGNGITNSTDNLIDFPVKETVYWVTGTDMAGCSATEKVPVEIKPDPAKPQIAGNKHICVGESLTLTASGSGTNSVYYWTHESSSQESTTVSPVSTTAYTVEVTGDNGCRITETVDVTVNSLPVITKFVGDTDVCFGKRVSLSVDASDVVSFTWNTGQTSKDINVAPDVSQYYSVEMRNSKNCVVRDSGYVAVIKPKVWIEGDTLACPRESITLTAAGANSYVWTTGDLTADITVSPVTKTKYTVTGTDLSGCEAKESIEVKMKPAPVPVIDGNIVICFGDTVKLTASDVNGATTFIWQHDPAYSSNTTTAVPSADTDYTVVATGDNGCSVDKTVHVTVNSLPVITGFVGDTSICFGKRLNLGVEASDVVSYRWNTGQTSRFIEVAPSASQYYSVEMRNSKNCLARDSGYVAVIKPNVIIFGDTLACPRESITLTAAGANSYVWTTGDLTADITVSPVTKTKYTVTGTDLSGCEAKESIEVKMKPAPVPVIDGNRVICFGDTVKLTASDVNGATTFIWQHDPAYSSNTTTAVPSADTDYTVVATGDNGCSVDKTVHVTVNSLPVITGFVGDTSICFGKRLNLGVEASDVVSYRWNTGQTSRFIEVAPSASQYYSVEMRNAKNCVARDSGYVAVINPNVIIIGDTLVCPGENLTLTAAGANSYVWTTGDLTADITVSPVQKSKYTVTGTDLSGCEAKASVEVKIKPAPVPVIDGNSVICAGETVTLVASDANGATSYVWQHDPTYPSNTATVVPLTDTVYTVFVTGDNGCSASKAVAVKVNALPTLNTFTDTAICEKTRITVQANAAGKGLSYLWSTGEVLSRIELVPDSTQQIWVEVSDLNGCKAKSDIFINTLRLPVLEVLGRNNICEGEQVELTASGALNYLWNTGDESSSLVDSPDRSVRYQVIGTDENGCRSAAVNFDVAVHRMPEVKIRTDKNVISRKDSEVFFETLINDEYYTADWDFGDKNREEQQTQSLYHNYNVLNSDSVFNIVLIAADSHGCVDTAYKTIYVTPFIPNTFTPDGDGVNDSFLSDCPTCENIKIYNRLGINMYDGKEGWDGRYNGKYVDNDTYFYVVTMTRKIFGNDVLKGYITVNKKQ